MSVDYERGYAGHGRGVVVTNDGAGNFSERPMTAGEIAARKPAWAIGADPYEFLTRAAAFAYIRAWEVIAPAIDAALAGQAAELNREVERRREAEAECEQLRRLVELPRASDLISALSELVGRQREWRVADIRAAIHASGIETTEKQIANGLAYLTRRGKVRRLGYGRYTPVDGSIGMEKEP